MKKKIVWLLVSCLMVLSLVLASCAPAVTEEKKVAPPVKEEKVAPPVKEEVVVPEKGAEMVKLRLTKLDGTVVEKMVEKPRYGGVFTEALIKPIRGLDPDIAQCYEVYPTNDIVEHLAKADWARGATGTGEISFPGTIEHADGVKRGLIAESWEYPAPDTVVFHIRKGVHFQNKPPANGREVTAYDVDYAFERQWSTPPTAYQGLNYPRALFVESMEATDKWTFVFKTKPGKLGLMIIGLDRTISIYPPEVIEKYGDLQDPRYVIGTGPFMMQDHVPAVATTIERNPDYYRKHPLYPEDTMPYLDGVKYVIIPDASTRMAALRTGKIDVLRKLTWDDARSLIKTNPELKWFEEPFEAEPSIAMRLDKPELPFDDIRVRQALSMGINRQAIKDFFYGGKGYLLIWPGDNPFPEYANMSTPLEEQPESIRELRSYNPEKAKQLLAEAGYPKGFKTEIVTQAKDVDLLSIVKEDWAKIGVDLKLDVKEAGVWASMGAAAKKTYPELFFPAGTSGTPWSWPPIRYLSYFRPGAPQNHSVINDPFIVEQGNKVSATFPDFAKRDALMKELFPYIHQQVYYIGLVTPKVFTFWQPWVKSYSGETSTGYGTNYDGMAAYIWIDQDLKEEMTGRR